MKGTSKECFICGRRVGLGDHVEVEYTTGEMMKGGRVKGVITEIWTPEKDGGYLQARVDSGWCFHDHDRILSHTVKNKEAAHE